MLPVEDKMGTDAGESGLVKKSVYGTPEIGSVIGNSTSKARDVSWDLARICLS